MIGPRQIRHCQNERDGAERVILLGGIGPNFQLLGQTAKALHAAGFATEVIHYPSTRYGIDELVDAHLAPAVARANRQPERPLHFLTFSMGGIVFRRLMQTHRPENLGRAVLVAPPNNGSEVADFFRNWVIYRWMFGPAGQQLGTCERSVPLALGAVDAEVGVIAGTRSLDPWFHRMFSREHRGAHDGKVTVASTKIAGMTDFTTVAASHYFIIRHPETQRQAVQFFRTGAFMR